MAVLLSDAALAVLSKASGEGLLLGFRGLDEAEPCVIGCCHLSEGSTIAKASWAAEISAILPLLPAGLSVIGLFTGDALVDTLKAPLEALGKELNLGGGSKTLVAIALAEGHVRLHLLDGDSLSERLTTLGDANPLQRLMTLRVTAKVTISPGRSKDACSKLRNSGAGFLIGGSHFVGLSDSGDGPVLALVPPAPEPAPGKEKKGAGQKGAGQKGAGQDSTVECLHSPGAFAGQVVHAAMVWTHGCGTASARIVAPVLVSDPSHSGGGSVEFEANAVGYFFPTHNLASATAALVECMCLQTELAASVLKHGGGTPSGLQFELPQLSGACITPIYAVPGGVDHSESALLSVRTGLHARFLLPMDRPYVRLAQACPVSAGAADVGGVKAEKLKNVHVGLGPGGVKGGKLHCVQGVYEYCHYMQDKFNDDGWGCMYRSLQTVVSWYRHQHYTSKPIPSHLDVQRILA